MPLSIKIFIISLFVFVSVNAESSNDFCKVLNSADLYSVSNITKIKQHLKNSYFPIIIPNGLNDNQYKYYIGKYQLAFGMKATGYLNENTLKSLKEQNECYDIEKGLQNLESREEVQLISKEELLQIILKNNVFNWDQSTAATSLTITSVPFTEFSENKKPIVLINPTTTPPLVQENIDTVTEPLDQANNITDPEESAESEEANYSEEVEYFEEASSSVDEEISESQDVDGMGLNGYFEYSQD